MRLLGVGEFRFIEEKTSAKGNPYYNYIFEDVDNHSQVKSYVRKDSVFTVPVDSLVKGEKYLLFYNRYYDYGKQQFDLVDVCTYSDKIHGFIKGLKNG